MTTASSDLREPHHDPRAVERPVEPGEEPGVERLGVRRRDPGQEAERAARDERPREDVALLDIGLEDLLALDRQREQAREGGGGDDQEGRTAWYPLRDAAHDSGTVRSGLVSRRTTARRQRLGRVRGAPGAPARGSRDRGAAAAARHRRGRDDEELWLARAREAAARGATRPPHALHEPDARTAERRATRASVSAARARGSASAASRPTLFCGGGWYTDHSVALACAELGYVGLHAARDPAALPRGRRRLGRARHTRADRPRAGARSPPSRPRTAPATWRARSCGRGCRRGCTRTSTTPTSSTAAAGR